jgi:hypothetical protein
MWGRYCGLIVVMAAFDSFLWLESAAMDLVYNGHSILGRALFWAAIAMIFACHPVAAMIWTVFETESARLLSEDRPEPA